MNQCLYFSCEVETVLFFMLIAFITLFILWLFQDVPKYLRLRECKSGKHRKIIIQHSGFGSGYETIECQCGKYKYLHDFDDDLTFRIK